MTKDQAETAVAGSALIVGGIYAYRKLVEPAITPTPKAKGGKVAQELGYGPPPPVGRFITGWGFAFLVLSLIAQASPNLGGSFAILVAVGDVLGNGTALAGDVRAGLDPHSAGAGDVKVPTTAGGVPVYDPSKASPEYDRQFYERLYQYGLGQSEREQRRQREDPLIPGNPLGGSPFPSQTR